MTDVDKNLSFEERMQKLCEFESPDEIAEFFKESGVRGVRRSNCDCPVSNYLSRPGENSVLVGSTDIWVPALNKGFSLPDAILSLVYRFDYNGYYDFLLREKTVVG